MRSTALRNFLSFQNCPQDLKSMNRSDCWYPYDYHLHTTFQHCMRAWCAQIEESQTGSRISWPSLSEYWFSLLFLPEGCLMTLGTEAECHCKSMKCCSTGLKWVMGLCKKEIRPRAKLPTNNCVLMWTQRPRRKLLQGCKTIVCLEIFEKVVIRTSYWLAVRRVQTGNDWTKVSNLRSFLKNHHKGVTN